MKVIHHAKIVDFTEAVQEQANIAFKLILRTGHGQQNQRQA